MRRSDNLRLPFPRFPSYRLLVETGKPIILYDSECPLCAFQMRLVTWLDWFSTVRILPISHPQAAVLAPALTREELLEAIHCVTPESHIYRGARCIRFVGLRMPLVFPLSLFLYFPGVIWVAERIYAWISRNRHLLSRWFGCREACRLLPARQRQGDAPIATPLDKGISR